LIMQYTEYIDIHGFGLCSLEDRIRHAMQTPMHLLEREDPGSNRWRRRGSGSRSLGVDHERIPYHEAGGEEDCCRRCCFPAILHVYRVAGWIESPQSAGKVDNNEDYGTLPRLRLKN